MSSRNVNIIDRTAAHGEHKLIVTAFSAQRGEVSYEPRPATLARWVEEDYVEHRDSYYTPLGMAVVKLAEKLAGAGADFRDDMLVTPAKGGGWHVHSARWTVTVETTLDENDDW